MPKKISLQKEKLIELSKTCTDAEIAKMYNVSEGTILNYRKKWNIAPHPRGKLPSDEKLRELYEIHTPAEIAEMYGCAYITVHKNLKRLGLSRNYKLPTGDEFKELYFKYPRKELAEMYGVHVVTVDYRAKKLGIYRDERQPKLQGGVQSKRPDKETLLNLLDKNSIEEIANMYEVSELNIYKWSLEYGIHRTKLVAASREEFLELYRKHTYAEIAEICGLSLSGVYWRIRKYGFSRKLYPLERQKKQVIS